MSQVVKKVGFIGIGNMGWPMAANLVKAGFEVAIHDTDPARANQFTKENPGSTAPGLVGVAQMDAIVTMLPNGHIVRAALIEADDGAFIKNAKPGTIVVDMSSSAPEGTRELAAELKEKEVILIDAPVSGAVPRATTGTLTIMIGSDDAEAIKAIEPLLLAMGNRLFQVGAAGCGHAAKALNNFLGAAAFAATSEAVLIAKRFGLDPATLIDIVNVSTGKSFISEIVMKDHVLDEKFASGFKLGLLAKDVRIAEALGRAVGLDAPLLRLVEKRWNLAEERIGYESDNTEAIKGWQDDL
jgi:3-hydroxyisobutyrate dehydrogenase